jgi:hypothetical protein
MATMASSQLGEGQGPLPNPPFVFPAKESFSSSAPSSFSRATGRRPQSSLSIGSPGLSGGLSNSDKRRSTPATLPTFSFNPSGAVDPETGMTSPPQSPQSPQSPQARTIPSRHRRGTSEFIGGKSGSGLGLLSTSPTKSEAFPSPNPSGRRGHAHRRSAALSSHDLSMILKPSTPIARGGSAPASPSDMEYQHSPFPDPAELAAQAATKEAPRPSEADRTASPEETTPTRTANQLSRVRVGFSDNVEYIPRPLSLVSSESSSTATAQGHSVSGSLTSIVSSGTSSPLSREQRTPKDKAIEARPKTAGPRLDSSREASPTSDNYPIPKRRSSNSMLTDSTTPQSSPRFPSRKWAFFGHEPATSGESSPSRSRPTSAASSKEPQITIPTQTDIATSIPEEPTRSIEQPSSRRSSVSRKQSTKKKQKKVKSWAGSILSRKSRQRSGSRKTRSPTPPLRSYAPIGDATSFDFNEPALSTSAPSTFSSLKQDTRPDFASWRPRHIPQQEDSMSPIIDLDAALGPFNTPSGRDVEWDIVNGTNSATKKGKRMHSAAGMGNFLGPGMHYHRRAESAPEFENPRFGLHRLGSSSTMADVFEEEEEDDEWEDAKASSDKESSNKLDEDEDIGLGIDIKVVDAEDMTVDRAMDWTVHEEGSLQRGVKRKGSGLSEGERRQVSSSMKSEHSSTSLKDEPIMEESPSPVEIVDDSVPSRPDSREQSSDSTATPPFRPRPTKDLPPVDIQPISLQTAYLTPNSPNSTTQSSFPSPRSPFSYDTQRISTAPSSFTDEGGFQSLLLGEPGPELRMSVDDVPSLTSSNSTMTRDSNSFPGSMKPQFRDGQRSASLSSAAVTRKRGSMASLSRLISSSHGEKSKLSIESRAPILVESDKKEKASKGKRISRMMQFWKPKELGAGS